MIKKTLFAVAIVACSLFSYASHAQTCPTVAEIKNHSLNRWKLYDTDDNKPLSAHRHAAFKTSIKQFALAEWNEKTQTIHCYYLDNNGSNLNAYLSKTNLFSTPKKTSYWYAVSGSLNCAAGSAQCQFESLIVPANQLAKR